MTHKIAVCLVWVAALLGGGRSQAEMIDYDATATSTLTITSISPMPLPGSVFIINAPLPSVSPPLEETSGNATVMTDGTAFSIGDPEVLRVDDGFANTTAVSGTVADPAPGNSFAFSLASGQILIDNESETTVTVEFLLTYTLTANAMDTDSPAEEVYAFSDVQLNWESSLGEFEFFIDSAGSDDRFGEPPMVSDSFAFSVIVSPSEVGNASLQTASFGDAEIFPDTDADGVPDNIDNCTLHANTDQADTNGDGLGNRCDPDVNNDCIVNFLDLAVYEDNFFLAGELDTDNNSDGITNFVDLNIVKDFFFGPPGPSAIDCN